MKTPPLMQTTMQTNKSDLIEMSILLRGHCDNSSELFSRDGNFLAVFKTLPDIDPILKHLETGSKKVQITSWKIQNEIISCIAESVRTEIRNILKESKYYSVIADEVTDRFANK